MIKHQHVSVINEDKDIKVVVIQERIGLEMRLFLLLPHYNNKFIMWEVRCKESTLISKSIWIACDLL